MKTDSKAEIENLECWIRRHKVSTAKYKPLKLTGHRALDSSKVVTEIVSGIKNSDLDAIELGCKLVLENKKIPFGRTLKSNIYTSLKQNVHLINNQYRQALVQLSVFYLNQTYPPRESQWLYKLVKGFEHKYVEIVLENVTSETGETQKWLSYLRS